MTIRDKFDYYITYYQTQLKIYIMKRILLLSLTLMLSVIAMWADNLYCGKIDGIYYYIDFDKETAAVCCYNGNNYDDHYDAYYKYKGNIVIPTSITYDSQVYIVTSVHSNAFKNCDDLISVTIPNSVTSIGDDAFWHCSKLTSVIIGNGLTSIGYRAFGSCSALTSINLPNSVTSISAYAFKGTGIYDNKYNWENDVLYIDNCLISAKKGKSGYYSIKEGTRIIADRAFEDSKLTSVVIPNSVTSLGYMPFSNCTNLTSVIIGSGVTSIEPYAFSNCSGLTSVTIPNSVVSIEGDAFMGCSALTSVTIPNSVVSIKGYAFADCSALTSVIIPNSVNYIGYSAFENCSALTSISIPSSVNYIGSNAFENTGIYNNELNWDKGALYLNNYLVKVKKNKMVGMYSIREGTKTIASSAFEGCELLTNLTIPNSIISIGSSAFKDCSALTRVNYLGTVDEWVDIDFGSNPTNYAKDLYINNELLTDVKITTANSIKDIAFSNCQSIKSVEIGESVTSIGEYAFSDCSGLTKVNYLGTVDKWVEIDFKDSNSNPTRYAKDLYINNELLTNVKITTADSIKQYAFYNCESIKSVELGNSVTSIGEGAFDGCNGLTSVVIGNSVISIGESAFGGCKGLTSVAIPNSVISIGRSAFSYCSSLVSVTIGSGVTSIGNGSFSYCKNLVKVNWNAKNCVDLSVSPYYWYLNPPFEECSNIKLFIIGNEVEQVPLGLFAEMSSLKELIIGSNVRNISSHMFSDSDSLERITMLPLNVPTVENNTFPSYDISLNVLCEAYGDYYFDDVFGQFKEIKCITSEEVEGSDKVEIEVDSNNNATIIWPSTGNASSYELVISKNGEVFCTLLFNENGQLTSIDFGNRSASVGFQFTVTGLDAASKYSYSIVAKDEKGNELESYNGTFTTNGYSEETAILETFSDAYITVTDGTISVDTDFTIYNTIGKDVTAQNGSLTPGVYIVNIGDDIAKVMVK